MSEHAKKPSPTFAQRMDSWREGNRDITREIVAAQKIIDNHVLLKNGPISSTVH